MNTMLSEALQDFTGLLKQLLTNLLGNDANTWEEEFKKFLRKEPCWVDGGEPKSVTPMKAQPKPKPLPLLIPINTTSVVATEEPIVLTEKVLRGRYNIKWRGGHFDTCFLGKTIVPFAGSTLAYKKLARRSVDSPIITELGGAIAARTMPIELLSLVEAQKNGEAGPLLTNGRANIAYWEDQIRFPDDERVAYTSEAGEKVVLRAVSVYWFSRDDGWDVYAGSVLGPCEWHGDPSQVFSRNSR